MIRVCSIFSQLLQLFPRLEFEAAVKKHNANRHSRGFECWSQLRIGPVVIGMEDLRSCCIMTTFDPDSGQQDLNVLRRVQEEFNGRLGLNSYVVAAGRISLGDAAALSPQ